MFLSRHLQVPRLGLNYLPVKAAATHLYFYISNIFHLKLQKSWSTLCHILYIGIFHPFLKLSDIPTVSVPILMKWMLRKQPRQKDLGFKQMYADFCFVEVRMFEWILNDIKHLLIEFNSKTIDCTVNENTSLRIVLNPV